MTLDKQGKATYSYPGGNRVERFLDKKGKKACIPYEGEVKGKSSKWLPYRWELVESSDKWLIGAEGEKCVESLIQQGFKAITWCGAGNDWDFIYEDARRLYQQGLHGFIYLRDNDDNPGKLKADKVAKAFRQAGIWVLVVNPADYKSEYNRIDKFDIADLLEKEAWENVLGWLSSQVTLGFNAARQSRQSSKSSTRSVAPTATVAPKQIDWDGIQEKYAGLRSERDREVYKLAIAQQFSINPYDVGRVLESSNDDDSDSIGDEVARALVSRDIDLSDYLPEYLASSLIQYSKFQRINQATILLALLSTTSSLHKPGSKVKLHSGIGFGVPPTLFAAIIAESGSKKSPIFREICKSPLSKIRREEVKNYANAKLDYDQLSDEEKANEVEPKSPPPMFVSDITGEGISHFASEYPNKSLLLAVDELAGLFFSQNAYRGGRGSDRQKLLSAYDGDSVSVYRVDGLKREAEFNYLSIIGTIQPDVIGKIIGDNQDSDGSFARFLFCRMPNVSSTLPDWDVNVSVADLLAGLYQNILDRPVSSLSPSPSAFKLFQNFYNKCEQMRIKAPTPCERAFWGKAEGLAGRLAYNLEVLSNPLGTDETISEKSMASAISLISFFHSELQALMVSIDPENSLAPHLVKLIEMSMRRGEISPRDVYTAYSKVNRPSAQIVKSWMNEAQNLGLGVVKKDGRSIKFCCNDGFDGSLMVREPSNQILAVQGLQANDGYDGYDGYFPEKNTHLKNLGDTGDPDTFSFEGSTHLDSLGKGNFNENNHHSHQNHQTAETIAVQGQTMMVQEPSIEPSLQLDYFSSPIFYESANNMDEIDWLALESALFAPVPAPTARRFNIGEIVKFAGGNGIVSDVNGDYILVSPLPSGDDVWMPSGECKPNPWFR